MDEKHKKGYPELMLKLAETLSKIVAKEKSYQEIEDLKEFREFLIAITQWRSWERMGIFAQINIKDKILDLDNRIKR